MTALCAGVAVTLCAAVVVFVAAAAGGEQGVKSSAPYAFAVAAAVTLVAVIAGVLAFLSRRRFGSGGHVRAAVGMVAAVGSLALVGIMTFTEPVAERDTTTGEIIRAGSVGYYELMLGDCLAERPLGQYDDLSATISAVP